MKKTILILMMLCLVGCGAKEAKEDKKSDKYCGDETSTSCAIGESADMSAYENFTDENNQFIKSSMREVLSLIEKKQSAVVYFGFPTCPWCIEAIPVLNEVAKEQKTNILYVQTKDDKGEYTFTQEQRMEMMKYSDEFLESDDAGNKKLYVPFVIVIKDGVVTKGHVGTVDGYDIQERTMNDDEKAQLKSLFTDMLAK